MLGSAANTLNAFILPAGTYWVGDPCYSVSHDRWQKWLWAADSARPANSALLVADIDGSTIVGVMTEHGDGTYTDQHGRVYYVDAGLIGLVPVEASENRYPGEDALGRLVNYDEPVHVSRTDEGVISLGNIVVNTGGAS